MLRKVCYRYRQCLIALKEAVFLFFASAACECCDRILRNVWSVSRERVVKRLCLVLYLLAFITAIRNSLPMMVGTLGKKRTLCCLHKCFSHTQRPNPDHVRCFFLVTTPFLPFTTFTRRKLLNGPTDPRYGGKCK